MLGIENERGVHRPHPFGARRLAVEQMKKMRGDGVVVGFDRDALAVAREAEPVAEHGRQ